MQPPETRDNWQTFRFGDLVRNVKAKVDRDNNPFDRYVAGQHMQTGDLRIREWGEFGNDYVGPAFHRRFLKGQVLYGSRRTYLKKVALAEFDGVTANTTFVLESKSPNMLLPELLPFIMLTDRFTEHSVSESKGSTNPYINWRDIAKYEFSLPPLDEQRRIAEILWATEEATECRIQAKESLSALVNALVRNFLCQGLPNKHSRLVKTRIGKMPADWECLRCEDIFSEPPRNGFSPGADSYGKGHPTLSIGAVRDGRVSPAGNLKYAQIDDEQLERYRLHPRDLLVVRGNGNRQLAARCGIVESVPENCFYPDLLIRIRFKSDRLIPEFACLQWNASPAHARLLRFAKSTNGIWKVNGKDLRAHSLAVPPIEEQKAFLRFVKQPLRQLSILDTGIARMEELKISLRENLLLESANPGMGG